MSEFNILPVFPSIISATKVEENFDNFWNEILNEEFFRSTADDSEGVYASKNMKILENFSDLKAVMLNKFYEFKNDVLRIKTTDFEITSSWITKTENGGFCQYHSHKNSYYSGIFYKNASNSESSGNLLFSDSGIKHDSLLINDPIEWNLYNSRRITIEPDKNLLIFFPSNLTHRISKYDGTEDRYSLAFNLFPVGNLGDGDSSVNIKVM